MNISNSPPAEKAEGDFASPNVQRGALPTWWSAETDAALLRGSLRHGFSPWSAELLDAQFEKIRVDPTLLFAELECAPPGPEPEGKKRDLKQDERDSSPEKRAGNAGGSDDASGPARMPGRETLKRRLLKLLDCLVRPRPAPPPPKEKPAKAPREAKPRAPTKREQKAAAREAAAVARKAADASAPPPPRRRSRGPGPKNGDASGMKESPPGATAATRKASDRLSLEAAERDVSSGMSPTSPMASPKADGGADAEAPAAKKARATPEKAPEKTATLAPEKKAATPEPAKKAATPEKKAATPAKKAATPEKKAATPAKKAATPAKKAATPAKKARTALGSALALSPRRLPRPVPRGRLSPRTRRGGPRARPPARSRSPRRAPSRPQRGSPRTKTRWPRWCWAAAAADPGPPAILSARPALGFKKAGASKTVGAAGKQTSLLGLGFFSKTPAGAGAGAPAARTPTTGGFLKRRTRHVATKVLVPTTLRRVVIFNTVVFFSRVKQNSHPSHDVAFVVTLHASLRAARHARVSGTRRAFAARHVDPPRVAAVLARGVPARPGAGAG